MKKNIRGDSRKRPEGPTLQPLRIPVGWSVEYNDFREIDPSTGHEDDFREDLLQLAHAQSKCVLDVGWYPEGNLKRGRFVLYLVRNHDWDKPLYRFSSRDRGKIAKKIDRILFEHSRGTLRVRQTTAR
jgi:hypothetical protein